MNDSYRPTFNIHEAVRKTLPYMMEMREYFHAHPELSEKEFDTCKTIFQELSLMGIEDVRIIAGTGVTGLIHGALPGPVVLLRADIDALPLTENYDCPYSSLVEGSCTPAATTAMQPTYWASPRFSISTRTACAAPFAWPFSRPKRETAAQPA